MLCPFCPFCAGGGSDPSEQSHHSARCTRLWAGQVTRRSSQLHQEEVPTGRVKRCQSTVSFLWTHSIYDVVIKSALKYEVDWTWPLIMSVKFIDQMDVKWVKGSKNDFLCSFTLNHEVRGWGTDCSKPVSHSNFEVNRKYKKAE